MKNTSILIFFCLCAFASFAQKDSISATPRDRIYLKNGFVIMGVITEKDSTGIIKLESGHKEFIYRADDIKRIEKEKLPKAPKPKIYGFKKMGYIGILECGYTYIAPSSQISAISMCSIHFINSMQESPLFMMGLSVGAEISNKSFYTLPIYPEARINFTKNHSSPFFEMAIGYSGLIAKVPTFDIYGNPSAAFHFFSGFLITPSLGWRIRINPKLAAEFSLSYKYTNNNIHYSFSQYNGNYYGTEYYTIYVVDGYLKTQSFSAKVGIQF